MSGWRSNLPDIAVGVVVLVLGVAELTSGTFADGESRAPYVLVVLAFAVAASLSRRAPFVALMLVWGTCALQLLSGTSVLTVQFAVAVVAFGCARWGQPLTVAASGISIPAAAVVGYVLVTQASIGVFRDIHIFSELMDSAYRLSDTLAVGATILGLLSLAVPWLVGLMLRARERAQHAQVQQERAEAITARAHRETEQAREIAQLREDQARLARDVHDVVGHSLAVILAQAESAQYLPDADTEALKRTMATIATSARTSLQDVRQVLSSPQHPTTGHTGAFEQLVEGVRAGGTEVVATEVGTPQPLPPELEMVAHRVVQEMFTNAIKHGRRDRPVRVERHWPEGTLERDLRIEVRNVEDRCEGRPGDATETQPVNAGDVIPGQGLEGMRRRLDSVGGRLDVRRRAEPEGTTFTTTAWVPVRAAP
jgi:signal transduction histidine kinase